MAKPVTLDSGWDGPLETYTRNKGSVGRKKIAFIGASYLFVHKLLRDMMLVGGFDDCHMAVHDIDEVPMNVTADLMERCVRQKKRNIRITRTLDRAEALKGADAVVLSISVGGREADQRSFEVCLKYGIPVGVGDTMGPAALARNLREVPVVIDIMRDVEKYCPKAVLLNFSNPMSVLTGTMARYSSIPCWGLCHSADSMFRYFADLFKVSKKSVQLEVGGVNHQAFVSKVIIKGKDRTGELLEKSLSSTATFKDTLLSVKQEKVNFQQDIFRILGVWPSTGDSHLAEFYKYFMTPRRIGSLQHGTREQVIPGRPQYGRREVPKIIMDWAYGDKLVGDLNLLTGEHAHELLWARFTGEPFTRILNLLNTDQYIKGLPRNACVEALVTVAGNKVTGKSIQLPIAVTALLQNWTTIHELSIQAAVNYDRHAARQALFLDPHVNDMYDIAPMLEDMLVALKPWLSEKWFTK